MNSITLPQNFASRASVASWLGALFIILFSLNTLGGWVRLSGSGIAIPQWPLIHGSLLPPVNDNGWQAVYEDWQRHQQHLAMRVSAGELSRGNLGREPENLSEFRNMFLTEYAHRLIAALAGLAMAGCLTVVVRDRDLRHRVGVPITAASALVVVQAVLGGFLIGQGTNTHWLFLHQGNAGLVMACILWSLLRLLDVRERPMGEGEKRIALQICAASAALAIWCQLLFGALVAGSKHNDAFVREFPTMMNGSYVPPLWESNRAISWNLLDNAWLHQWVHRWFAGVLVLLLVGTYAIAARTAIGPRLRLSLQVSATFIGIQMLLGIANVFIGGTTVASFLPLAHQFMGMCLFVSVILALYDIRHEPGMGTSSRLENISDSIRKIA